MLREGDLNEISDGRLYTLNDLVRADCQDCTGCSACCHGMGNSIVLTPYDVCLLTNNLSCSFEQLITGRVELSVIDGLILPSLKMSGDMEQCSFLDENGRCSIHSFSREYAGCSHSDAYTMKMASNIFYRQVSALTTTAQKSR